MLYTTFILMVHSTRKNGKVGDGGSYCFTNIVGDTLRQSNIDWKSPVLDEIPIKTTIYRGFPSYIPHPNPYRRIA